MKHTKIMSIISILLFSACGPLGGGKGSDTGSLLPGIIPFVLIFALFYFLILRPQQKQNKERNEMMKTLKRGDNIITSGGMYGKVVNVNEDILSVEIAKGVNIKMSRSGVTGIANPVGENKGKEGKQGK